MHLSIRSIVQSTIVASLFSTQVLAASPAARDSILARQLTGQQCKTNCANFDTDMSKCGDSTSCACTSAHASALQDCINCSIALAGSYQSAVIATDQQSADLFMQLCPGFTITAAGGSSNTGTPSAAGASSTADAGKTTGAAGSTTNGNSASATPTATSSGTKSTSGAVSPGSNIGSGSHLIVVSGMVWAMGIVLAV